MRLPVAVLINRLADARVVLVVAVVVRGGALYALRDNLQDDPDAYQSIATSLVRSGTFGFSVDAPRRAVPTAYRGPLYPVVLAAVSTLPIDRARATAWLHLILGVATVLITLAIARRWAMGRCAPLAALLVAVDPVLLYFGAQVMTETLATFLATLALWNLILLIDHRRLRHACLGGGCLALAALCRPEFTITLFSVIGVGWALIPAPRLRLMAGMAISAAVVVLPWVVRNTIVFGMPIATTTHGGYTFHLANNASFYEYLREAPFGTIWDAARWQQANVSELPTDGPARSPRSEIAQDRAHYRQGWDAIRQQPGMFLYACLIRAGRLWQLVPHRTDPAESTIGCLLRYGIGLWYAAVFVAALAGVWVCARGSMHRGWILCLLVCASITAVHLAYWSNMRMRGPVMPCVCLLAGASLTRLDRWATDK